MERVLHIPGSTLGHCVTRVTHPLPPPDDEDGDADGEEDDRDAGQRHEQKVEVRRPLGVTGDVTVKTRPG